MTTRMLCSVSRIRLKMSVMTETAPYLGLHVPPDEMVKYIQALMTLPHDEIAARSAMTLARRHWGGDTPLARAALLAAAGIAPLVIDNERAVFDIPALLDATLEFQPPAGQA